MSSAWPSHPATPAPKRADHRPPHRRSPLPARGARAPRTRTQPPDPRAPSASRPHQPTTPAGCRQPIPPRPNLPRAYPNRSVRQLNPALSSLSLLLNPAPPTARAALLSTAPATRSKLATAPPISLRRWVPPTVSPALWPEVAAAKLAAPPRPTLPRTYPNRSVRQRNPVLGTIDLLLNPVPRTTRVALLPTAPATRSELATALPIPLRRWIPLRVLPPPWPNRTSAHMVPVPRARRILRPTAPLSKGQLVPRPVLLLYLTGLPTRLASLRLGAPPPRPVLP
ncbi:hypothetical protein FNL39_103329 [Nocardia caishijiensis]|uniref:Uncharacterized protein n=1 Tax=Nocardia caishijiensis TaxID=184756 RepID=A0ABQ6YNY3_9NOCA|nr:hypothetical protein FNL39_103329 [Nocardia caishijiensis]